MLAGTGGAYSAALTAGVDAMRCAASEWRPDSASIRITNDPYPLRLRKGFGWPGQELDNGEKLDWGQHGSIHARRAVFWRRGRRNPDSRNVAETTLFDRKDDSAKPLLLRSYLPARIACQKLRDAAFGSASVVKITPAPIVGLMAGKLDDKKYRSGVLDGGKNSIHVKFNCGLARFSHQRPRGLPNGCSDEPNNSVFLSSPARSGT